MGRWLAAAAWTALLLAVSSELFSSSHTGGLLRSLLGGLLSPEVFEWVHAGLRKLGHLTGYGIASVLYYRALVGTGATVGTVGSSCHPDGTEGPGRAGGELDGATPPPRSLPPVGMTENSRRVVALLLVLVVASLDEVHQSTIPSRTGTPVDVLIDLTGGTIAQLLLRVEWRRRANC